MEVEEAEVELDEVEFWAETEAAKAKAATVAKKRIFVDGVVSKKCLVRKKGL